MPSGLSSRRSAWGSVLASPDDAHGLAGITVRFVPEPPSADAGAPCQPALRALAGGNPAAQSLRLLEILARGTAGSHALAYLDGRLDVAVVP